MTTSLFHSGVFMLNTAMISAQYGSEYPKDRREVINPFNNTYVARDGLIMTLCAPEYDRDFDKVMTLLGREDLAGNTQYNICDVINANKLNGEVVDILDEAFAAQPGQGLANRASAQAERRGDIDHGEVLSGGQAVLERGA